MHSNYVVPPKPSAVHIPDLRLSEDLELDVMDPTELLLGRAVGHIPRPLMTAFQKDQKWSDPQIAILTHPNGTTNPAEDPLVWQNVHQHLAAQDRIVGSSVRSRQFQKQIIPTNTEIHIASSNGTGNDPFIPDGTLIITQPDNAFEAEGSTLRAIANISPALRAVYYQNLLSLLDTLNSIGVTVFGIPYVAGRAGHRNKENPLQATIWWLGLSYIADGNHNDPRYDQGSARRAQLLSTLEFIMRIESLTGRRLDFIPHEIYGNPNRAAALLQHMGTTNLMQISYIIEDSAPVTVTKATPGDNSGNIP